ncbi:MAG: DUF1566 domain-containing protein [bacterium]|nr:DUF1566 domain-containing protein [bacterium]
MVKLFLICVCIPLVLIFTAQCAKVDDSGTEEPQTEQPVNEANADNFPVVDTGQTDYYDENGSVISAPGAGQSLYGQDAHYGGLQPDYTDNGDGTVTDNNTGLMWQQDPGNKMGYSAAEAGAETFSLAGYTDWRLPTIKELYSLILFSGTDPSGPLGEQSDNLKPFIDTEYFTFRYGDESVGERIIDSQYTSATRYVDVTMNGDATAFGVNFADGRIKGYGLNDPRTGGEKTFYVMYVRGTADYGANNYTDNGDDTVTDSASGLMWMKDDSGVFVVGEIGNGSLNWEQALEWAENLEYGGYSDWRLPNAKELQGIVDYSRSPATSNSAAIDPVFNCTSIINEGGSSDYPCYWTGTTHANTDNVGRGAAYVAFGRALGWMQSPWSGEYQLLDVHGAGAQRSDPKMGNPGDYPYGHGPQGDVIRIYNYVRCVRNAE